MTSFWKQLIICILLVTATTLAWQYHPQLLSTVGFAPQTADDPAKSQKRSEGTPIIVAQTISMRDDRTFSAIGTGFALRSITLRASSDGEIEGFNVTPGREFAAGEMLMQLEDRDEQFAVSLAQTRLDRARDERDRYSQLQVSGVAAIARLEDVETDFQVATIELDRALEALDKRVLRAPFDGITGLASVELGDRIETGDAIGRFDDRRAILVEFDLPEALLGRVSIGLEVSATTPSVEGRSFDGQVSAIDSHVDPATRTARVRAEINNASDLLRPGASFALELELPGNPFPAVPELALQFSEGALLVWRVTEGMAEPVTVRLVRRRAGLVIVDGPLAEGDLIVVEGTQRLRRGSAVHVLNTPQEQNS
ncbi:MAG: efflux RND transporter periplasmic adaptor subunit [Roseobacter sp.]